MGEPKIVVVDYHKGNLSSVVRGLVRAGAAACTSDDPEQIRNADGLVIPGVGAFYDAIAFMRQSGDSVKHRVRLAALAHKGDRVIERAHARDDQAVGAADLLRIVRCAGGGTGARKPAHNTR